MFPHVLTPEQRAAAQQKARLVRKARAEVKMQLKKGEMTLTEALTRGESDPVVGGMRVTELLKTLPGIGEVRAAIAMDMAGIRGRGTYGPESCRVGGLSSKQRAALSAAFGE